MPTNFADFLSFDVPLRRGNRLSMKDSKMNTFTTMTYDALDRQSTEKINWVTATSPIRFDYLYTDRGEVSRLKRFSDLAGTSLVVRTEYTYDDGGRLTNLQNFLASGATTGSYSYDYDAADRLTGKQEGVINSSMTELHSRFGLAGLVS